MTTPKGTDPRCLIVGAGISGLMAARVLSEAGLDVLLIDREEYVGGRVSTAVADMMVYDEGAQILTVSDSALSKWVREWLNLNVVEKWCHTEPNAAKETPSDDLPRYRGTNGMSSIVHHLAKGLDIRLGEAILSINVNSRRQWEILTDKDDLLKADALILTPPVPLSLRLIDSGNVRLPEEIRHELESIEYMACISVMMCLDGPSKIPDPCVIELDGEPISWIVDNHNTGPSSGAECVTILAGPEFSRKHFKSDNKLICKLLSDAAAPYLDSKVVDCMIRRWRHSKAAKAYQEPCLYLEDPAPLIMAGDGFGGPGVDGAALSGLAAADHLLSRK